MTSEEYVVKKLLSLEEENGRLKANIDNVTKSLERVDAKCFSLIEMLRKHASYETSSLGNRYIDIATFYDRNYDKEAKADFQFMQNLLGVADGDFKPYVAPVIEETEEEEEEGEEECQPSET